MMQFSSPKRILMLTAALMAFAFNLTFTQPAALAQAAASTQPVELQAGYDRIQVGNVQVVALSDGTVPMSAYDFLTNTTHEKIDALLAAADVTNPVNLSFNAYLVHLGDRVILIDTGAGALFGPTLGKLQTSMAGAGYRPDQITDILVTHLHPDHIGGLMDGKNRVFQNATVHLDKRELAYWLSKDNEAKAPESKKGFFQQAALMMQPYIDAGKVKTFDGATELFPGLRTIPAPGHTPGHTFYVLESQGQKLVFWGDVVHEQEVQFADPSVTVGFDTDSTQALATRKAAFADAAKNHYLVALAHMYFPGIGHVVVDGDHYRWLPVPYLNNAPAAKK